MKTAKKNSQLIDTSTEVSVEEKTFLMHGTKKVPISAEPVSKYSLLFRYLENRPVKDSDEPVNLLIRNNGQSIVLGPCRILSGPELNEYTGRLVFLHDVYDFQSLLRDNKVVRLQSAFSDLPLLFTRKEKIKPIFKSYVADLKFDLQIYKNLFDDLDIKYCAEPDIIRKSIQSAIIETDGPKLMEFLDNKLKELESVIYGYSRREHQYHGFYFRKQIWEFLMCCPLMARTNLKPRGYPGDSEMMRMIYANDFQGNSTFAKILHKHAVETPAAQSVRNRINIISKALNTAYTKYDLLPNEKFKVFSIACGPALELLNILRSSSDCKKYHFVLMDQDPLALNEASDLISQIENRLNSKISVDFLNGLVRTVLSSRKIKQKWDRFNFIYSLGLFDYLAPPVAKAVLCKLYDILKPGGEIIVGNFHESNPSKYYMEYWGDWVFFHRNEEEFTDLLADEPRSKGSVFFEDTGSQMFLHIKKN